MIHTISFFGLMWVTIEITDGFYNIDVVTKGYGFSFMNGTLFIQKEMHTTIWSKSIYNS